MAAPTRFQLNYRSMGNYLRTSPELAAACLEQAKGAAEFARAIAPIGPDRRGSQPSGEFRESIAAESYTGPGGFIGARVTASPVWVEFGRRHRDAYHGAHVLGRTKDAVNAPKRTA